MMKMKYALTALVCLSIMTGSWAAEPPATQPDGRSPEVTRPLVLKDLLLQVQDHNPEILAARQTWKVKEAEVRPAGTWEGPMFTFIDERFPSGMEGVDPATMRHYRIEQRIPFPGKLTNAAKMKHHEALIAQADYRARLIDVFKEVRMRYYQLYLADQQIGLANQSAEILKNALRAAQSRLAGGQSSALDVFMVQTELAKAEDAAYRMQQQRRLVQAELNALLNQDSETPLGDAQAPALEDLPLSLADFKTLARRTDPLYLSSLHEINHAQAMLAHHRLDFAPDFGVMAERETAPAGPAGRQIGVSISFPLWVWSPISAWRGAKEHMSETEAKSQAMQNLVMKNVAGEFVETNTRLTVARHYIAAILPAAGSALRIAQKRYASGQDDFLRLLEAYRTWIASHNEFQEQLYEYAEHQSLLGQWVGVDIAMSKAYLDQIKTMPEDEHGH